jgi:hypothetical protein
MDISGSGQTKQDILLNSAAEHSVAVNKKGNGSNNVRIFQAGRALDNFLFDVVWNHVPLSLTTTLPITKKMINPVANRCQENRNEDRKTSFAHPPWYPQGGQAGRGSAVRILLTFLLVLFF